MFRVSKSLRTTRAIGKVFFRQSILQGLEDMSATDNPFSKSGDRPYPIGEIVRRMVRIKKKCISAVSLGDDHEHALLRGEYKYFTGKSVDVRGASVTDLIAFVQCCSFFKFYDTGSLDRVLEELSLKVSTLQPLEVLALMVAVSDLPSKSLGLVDLDKVRQRMDEADDIATEARNDSINLLKSIADGSPNRNTETDDGSYSISRKDVHNTYLGGGSSSCTDAVERANCKNFTDFRFRKFAIGSNGGSRRQVSVLEGSSRSAMREADVSARLSKSEYTYHATLSASFFTELCNQALLFLGDSPSETSQYSVEEQLEMLGTLPEGADQDLVMALLDSLAAPLIHYDHYVKTTQNLGDTDSFPQMTPMVEQGFALREMYTAMPWHAVTVAKGLLLVELEAKEDLDAAEAAMELGFERFSRQEPINGRKNTLSKAALYRQRKARDEMSERKQRNEGNALFIGRAGEILGSIVCSTASKPFEVSRVHEKGPDEDFSLGESDDALLAYGRECSDAVPAGDRRKLSRDFYAEHTSGSTGGFAGGQGIGSGSSPHQQRLQKRTHMLTPWEISSAAATLAHLASTTAPILSPVTIDTDLPLGKGGLSFMFSKELQQAYIAQLPQCDAVSLALMFSTCRPNANRYLPQGSGVEVAHLEKKEFLKAQKQFFAFLRLTEERVIFHSSKFTFVEMIDVLGSYMEAYSALGSLHNTLCDELASGTALDKARTRKEVAAAKSRLSSNAQVIDALLSDSRVHIDSLASGELSDSALPLAMLATLSLHVFNPLIAMRRNNTIDIALASPAHVVERSQSRPLSRQELWFHRFPQLQPLIHALGAVLVKDASRYSIRETLIVLQIAVRMGDKMLDAAVTAALRRLSQLVELEDYASHDPFSLNSRVPSEHLDVFSELLPLSTSSKGQSLTSPKQTSAISHEVKKRQMQRESALSFSDSDSALLVGKGSQFEISPQIRERLEFAASVAARNHAGELFAALEELCAFTERRLEEERRARSTESSNQSLDQFASAGRSIATDKELLQPRRTVDDLKQMNSQFDGLRPKQIDFIQRMLLPALRKASLATN